MRIALDGPSGAGKDTIIKTLTEKYPDRFAKLVSVATRAMRPHESQGNPYHFVNNEEFDQMVASGDIFEHTVRHGEKRGMSEKYINTILEQNKIAYESHTYDATQAISGMEVAMVLNENPEQVFKTLVTVGASKQNYVFVVPVCSELNLKKAAKAVGEKNIEMIKSKELLPLTGYIHGGCSPIGMKKLFTTVIDETAVLYDTIIFSGGKIGVQVELKTEDFKKIINIKFADIAE
mgnify:CR=1 FL=1